MRSGLQTWRPALKTLPFPRFHFGLNFTKTHLWPKYTFGQIVRRFLIRGKLLPLSKNNLLNLLIAFVNLF